MSPGKRFAPINPTGGPTTPSADGEDWQAPQATPQAPERPAEKAADATAPRGHDAAVSGAEAPARKSPKSAPKGNRSKPAVESSRAMTVRFEPSEADEVDRFVLDLRSESGQHLDKADVVRELIRLAQLDPAVRRKLVRRLL